MKPPNEFSNHLPFINITPADETSTDENGRALSCSIDKQTIQGHTQATYAYA